MPRVSFWGKIEVFSPHTASACSHINSLGHLKWVSAMGVILLGP